MIRGAIWTAADGPGYAGKRHTVVILQSDRFAALDPITVSAFTTDPTEAPLLRLAVERLEGAGLAAPSRIMVDSAPTALASLREAPT